MDLAEGRGHIPTEIQTADALKRVIAGQTVNTRAGDWHVSNVNSPFLVELQFGPGDEPEAIYGFDISSSERTDSPIVFTNYHREALIRGTGAGTRSLVSLEASLSHVARGFRRDIEILYPRFGTKNRPKQPDTIAWLRKNGYTEHQPNPERGLPEIHFTKNIRGRIAE